MIRGGGCAIRPAPTPKWAAATYLAIGTTTKKVTQRHHDQKSKPKTTNLHYEITGVCYLVYPG